METIFDQPVSNLPAGQRESLEAIIGRHLEGNQRVYIRVLDPPAEPDEATRQAGLAQLNRLFAISDERAKRAGITAEEADAAVEEGVRAVRRGAG